MPDFKPTLSPIHEKSPFRFWCQKVLPTVYDDSLSYYELLTKVVYYLNENTTDLETVNSNVESLYNSYVELQNYVNNYFDQNFPQLVQDRLDEMVEDGTFDELLHAIVDPYFAVKSEEINDTLDQQNDYITWLRNQWDVFINSSAGLPNERTLWSGRLYVENSVIDLDYSYEDYDYLEVYLAVGSTTVPQIFKLDRYDVQNKDGGAWINYPTPAVNESNAGTLIVTAFNIQRVMVEGEDSSDVDYTKLKLTVNAHWSWNGQSDSNGNLYHYTQGEDPLYNLEFISKIVGIKAVQMDNEIVDARTGYNGTVYQTLGQAIRTQVQNLENQILYIEQGTLMIDINGTSYPVKKIESTTVSGVQGWKWTIEDGSLDGRTFFFADGVGLNTIKTQLESEMSDIVDIDFTTESGSALNPYTYGEISVEHRDGTFNSMNVGIIDPSTHKLYADSIPTKSTVVAGNKEPINAIALINYINSLDANNTSY